MTCNHEKTESPTTNVLLALLAGAGVGLAIGVLMAPKAGNKLRAEIGDAVNGYLDSACAYAESARAKVTAAVDSGARDINSAIDQTVSAVRTGAKFGHEAVNSTADAVRAGTAA